MSFAISIGCGIAFSKCGVFAKVSRNRGTTDGLHAGRRLCGAQIPDVDRIVACLPDQNAIILNVK